MIKLKRPVKIITGDEKLEVTREGTNIPSDVQYVDGKPVKIAPECFQIICNIQPLGGRDLQLVPEMDRIKEQFWVWTNQKQKPLLVNDIVARSGLFYQVQTAENWGSYSKCRIMRIDVGPLANKDVNG